MISFLTDPLLQKYVELKPSPTVTKRIDLWLGTCLEDLYENHRHGAEDPYVLSEVLDGAYRHAQYTKVSTNGGTMRFSLLTSIGNTSNRSVFFEKLSANMEWKKGHRVSPWVALLYLHGLL